jgi:hypothetical protein
MGELQAPTYTPQPHQPPATPTPTPNLNASCNGATQEKPHQKSKKKPLNQKQKFGSIPYPNRAPLLTIIRLHSQKDKV